MHGQIEVTGVARLLGPLATKAFERGMTDNLRTLKSLLEAAP